MKKTAKFKKLLQSSHTEYIMESHNAICAKIVEEAGFKGIWGSGLTMSASMGMRDNNEISWTEIVNEIEYMSDATTIPILLDADTGYGNFNNVRILVHKLEKLGVAGISIEDKLFPKTNSFINGDTQKLADIGEFCGKIRAAKDTQLDPDFCVVARTESFITNHGLNEALKRAFAYYEAGADAIFIHSKKSTPKDIIDFMKEWKNTCPVIIAPTTYYTTHPEVFEKLGVSLVIWANMMMRASIRNMSNVACIVARERSICELGEQIAPVGDIFRLQNAQELLDAEKIYQPVQNGEPEVAVSAAGSTKVESLI